MRRRLLPAIGLVAPLLALVTACRDRGGSPPGSTAPGVLEANAAIERVVDGDTVVVRVRGHTETVRLIGVNTPETVKPHSPVECYGPEASAWTKHALPAGTAVRLVRDVEARDVYGRLLAYVYRAADGMFVNGSLAELGYATVLTIAPNTAHRDEFVADATLAERAGLGLWTACSH